MDFLDRLTKIMNENGDNNSSLAKKSGIPYTTIDGIFKRGWENAKLNTIQKICDYYKVSLDYMVYGVNGLSEDALVFASKFDAVPPSAKKTAKTILDAVFEFAATYNGIPILQMHEIPHIGTLNCTGEIETRHAAKKEVTEMQEDNTWSIPQKP